MRHNVAQITNTDEFYLVLEAINDFPVVLVVPFLVEKFKHVHSILDHTSYSLGRYIAFPLAVHYLLENKLLY
jgi:hypothetical protein